MKPVLLTGVLLGLVASASPAAAPFEIRTDHECRRATGPIKLGGKADEPAWQQAVIIGSFAAPGLMSCAPLTAPSFHRHEDSCRLKFVAPAR